MSARRIGLVVPSSNTTVEAELPELLRRREAVAPERFTCHASRVQMRQVTPEELVTVRAGHGMPVVTSAGALVAGLATLGARRIALIAPYVAPLTADVVGYLGACGVEVADAISLGVADNIEVGRLDPAQLVGLADKLDVGGADAVVLSACVQMPSLPAVPVVERRLGLPVLTATTATVHQLLTRLELTPDIPDAGRLLAMA